jgi:hypothetical protein
MLESHEPNDVSSDSGEEYIEKGSDVADEDDEEEVLYESLAGDQEVVVGQKVMPGKKSKKEKGSLRKEVRSALNDGRMPAVTVKDKRKAENEL